MNKAITFSSNSLDNRDKQKTKKVREIQITQISIVSITISYIFCALDLLCHSESE